MHIFVGADHRGFELKNKIIEYLQEKNIRVEDMGNYEYKADDDFPDYANKVVQALEQMPEDSVGIVICGSGAGVTIAANKHKGILCALGFQPQQTQKAREDDHINVLALAADYQTFDEVKPIVDAFLDAKPRSEERFLRRLKKIE